MAHLIADVYPMSNYRLLTIFEGGEQKIYDVKPLFDWKEIFKALKENELFYEVYVGDGGYCVVWNDQIDLSSEEIWNRGAEVSLDDDELDILLADEALKQYRDNTKTYSQEEIKKMLFIETPNEETQEAFEEVENIRSGNQKAKRYKNTKEMRTDLKL